MGNLDEAQKLKEERDKLWRLAEIDIQENAQKENTKEILKKRKEIEEGWQNMETKAEDLKERIEKGCREEIKVGIGETYCGMDFTCNNIHYGICYCEDCQKSIKLCEDILK